LLTTEKQQVPVSVENTRAICKVQIQVQ